MAPPACETRSLPNHFFNHRLSKYLGNLKKRKSFWRETHGGQICSAAEAPLLALHQGCNPGHNRALSPNGGAPPPAAEFAAVSAICRDVLPSYPGPLCLEQISLWNGWGHSVLIIKTISVARHLLQHTGCGRSHSLVSKTTPQTFTDGKLSSPLSAACDISYHCHYYKRPYYI